MVMFHPGFMVFFGDLPIAALLIVFATVFDTGENYDNGRSDFLIHDQMIRAAGHTHADADVTRRKCFSRQKPPPYVGRCHS